MRAQVTVQRACHNSFIEWAKGDSPHDPWPPTVSVRIKDVLIAQSRTFVQKVALPYPYDVAGFRSRDQDAEAQ